MSSTEISIFYLEENCSVLQLGLFVCSKLMCKLLHQERILEK